MTRSYVLASAIRRIISISTLGLFLVACHQGKYHSGEAAESGVIEESSLSAAKQAKVLANPYAMASVPTTLSLEAPTGLTIASAAWDFHDGTPVQTGLGPMSHPFFGTGVHTVTVSYVDSLGQPGTLEQSITLLPYDEQLIVFLSCHLLNQNKQKPISPLLSI